MKKIFLHICLLFFVMQLQAQNNTVDSNFHLYLLIGQSNMAGRGAVDAVSKETDPRIVMLDSFNNWVPATDPVHFDKPAMVGVGPAIGFAKEMLQANGKIKIGLIPCAWGGSPVKVWEPGAAYLNAHPYDDAVKRTKIAMQLGVLKGILWHQGESDNDSVRAPLYINKLQQLVQRLRDEMHLPQLPFVAGEIGYFNKVDIINKEINRLPRQVNATAVVSAKDLTDKGDKLHFNTASARELGKRYAIAMQQLQQPVAVLCFDDAEISHYTIVAPLLKKFGFNATFFVCEMPYKSPGDSVYYMKWEQIASLYKMGFEIGNHTGHHKNMTKMKREEMQQEIAYIETKCTVYGIPKPLSFAYPGNRSDSLSQVVLKEMGYSFARAGGSKFYQPDKDARLELPSFTMGSGDKLGARTLKALQVTQPGQIIIFTIHGVPDLAHPDYTTTEAAFTSYLQYMKDNNFKVIAVKELEQYIK